MSKAWAALALALLLVPAAISPGSCSEPAQEILAVYNETWNLASEPLDASYLGHYDHERIYVSEDPDDPAFYSYIRGEIPRSRLAHPEIEEGKRYHVFFVSGAQLYDDAFGRIRLDLLDHSAIQKPAPTAVLLAEGYYELETEESVNDHVNLTGGSLSGGRWPCKDGELPITISREGVYDLMLNSGEWCCLKFKAVSGDVQTLPAMAGTTPHDLATSYRWARGEFDIGPGDYAFSQYTFPAGSEEDLRFKSEVVEALQTVAPEWADDWLRQSVDNDARMAAYRLVSDGQMKAGFVQYGDGGAASSHTIMIENPELTGPDLPDRLVLFAPAHERVSLAFSYDSSRYAVMLEWGEGPVYAAPDSRYDLHFDKAKEIDVTVETLGKNATGPDMFSTTIMTASENVPEPDGYGAAFVALCIGLCLAVMLLLLWAGRARRWED
ncbi:MAG: hypothetical protein J5674_04610 [Candidatus Methanomethylophilaceae archaeon]|nr:hypothetical protein [Candidatus Methanomethylophilaceae archaeon]